MVTLPDFANVEEVRAFLQTYIKLVQDLKICTGDLETGALRVDVNINVEGHQRVEIKNLPTISAIINAIRYEEKRQRKAVVENPDLTTLIETRGWDGKKTYHLRDKESAVDYRYVPDMELPNIKLDLLNLIPKIEESLPLPTSEQLDILMDKTKYNLSLRDARILVNNDELHSLFEQSWNLISHSPEQGKIRPKLINWLVHELLGSLTKSEIEFTESIISPKCFTDLIMCVETGKITKSNGKLMLLHLVNNKDDQMKEVAELAEEFNMLAETSIENDTHSAIDEVVAQVLHDNGKVVDEIKNKGKVKKINFLIGLCMRETKGNVQPKIFEDKIKSSLDI